jgi:hypothetical protein
MKYLGLSVLALLFALSVETSAQDNPFGKGDQGSVTVVQLVPDQGSCPDYKIGIVTPPSNVDFKMTLITPPNDIDPGIVLRLCGAPSQLALGPQVSTPSSGTNYLSAGNVFMSGQRSVFVSRQRDLFMPGKIK